MSEEATFFCDKLADEGYYCLAPDLFRNVASPAMNILWNIYSVVTTSQDQIDSDSDAALAYLLAIDNINPNAISSGPGFCFGGTQALIFSSRHTMAATVTCYGTYIKELHDADSSAWGKLKDGGPVLGIYGETDTRPSPDDAEKFRQALAQNDMTHTVTIYPGVGHAFIKPKYYKEGKSQTVDAWNQIEEFLASAFANAPTRRIRAIRLNEQKASISHVVPNEVALYHKLQCALKCAQDHFTQTGHWNDTSGGH